MNNQHDQNGISYARRAMIMKLLSLNLNGSWSEGKLTDELQSLFAQLRNNFEGEPVFAAYVETESDSDA